MRADRPHMPSYGVTAPGESTGLLLPWSWAQQRLGSSRYHRVWFSCRRALANARFAVRPVKVIGLVEDDFTGSPTRWRPDP